ncbi:tRNA 2-selenouridine(34) synthase MnmH [Sebaldella sp. S0638]|uniref:tRNA 2-selenouridine(34) synthase MnmH n=1 Tax=Sebaldella sp. S0638 TaxID=2957809 RepID=UPI00209D2013|nr:tRNA 2-selenouridine(34) synthase MnmH [Sebaldella sp. S0638]MCP1224251.1 tRNA 2-selenouridine(34) synthase MnmH [Sebaldella sp. S0638]
MVIAQSYEKLSANKGKVIFIDVRTPKEYREAHIPGAVNIPVFSDKDREVVGTIYKQEGKRNAIKEALKIVGPKVLDLYLQFEECHKGKNRMVIYCARGGMRSSAVTALMKELSLPLIKLENGYKGYRQYINDNLPVLVKKFQFVTLYGKTGSGKTDILKRLKNEGYDILDLEACANNRGSLLGDIGLGEKYSQKYFESLVFESLTNAESNIVITEGESRRIGNIVMPPYLYEVLINSRKLYIETSLERRTEIIKKEYLKDDVSKEEIISSIERLRKYINGKQIEEFVNGVKNEDYDKVIKDLMIKYYDKAYSSKGKTYERVFNNDDEDKCVKELTEYIFSEK